MGLFNVRSKRSGAVRTVYAVKKHENPHLECTLFLMFSGGQWVWEIARNYEPVEEKENDKPRIYPL